MTIKELAAKAHTYFGMKLPPPETGKLWEEEVGKYPAEFYDWCYERIKSSTKKVMENFPKSVTEAWGEWIWKNPNKVERREFSCGNPACEFGLILFWKKKNNVWSRYAARCGHCRVLQHGDQTMLTQFQIEREGWMVSSRENDKLADIENAEYYRERVGQMLADQVERLSVGL